MLCQKANNLLKSCCNGQVLAKKMTVLYALSQGQLSKQYHYAACRQDVGNTFKRDLLHAWKQLQDLPEMDTIELLGDEHIIATSFLGFSRIPEMPSCLQGFQVASSEISAGHGW
jgi:hypothetical protein